MTDRELLEAAAKAAGMNVSWQGDYDMEGMWLNGERSPDNSGYWDPLNADGDALRLAVKLRINIEHVNTLGGKQFCISCYPIGRGDCLSQESVGDSPMLTGRATRRAIVRAAAALAGKATT